MTSTSATPPPPPKSKAASTEAVASRMAASLDATAVEPTPAPKAPAVPAVATKDHGKPAVPAAGFPTPDLDGMYRMVKDGISRVSKTVETVQDTARDTTKLMIGSRSLVAERSIGMQRKLLEMMELNFTAGLRAMQAIARADSVKEAVAIQTSYCQDALKTLQSQGETLRTLSADLAKDVREPIQAQVKTSVERMKSALKH